MASTERGNAMIAVSVMLVSLAGVSVALRFAARRKRNLDFQTDDWLSLTGQILLFVMLTESILWVVMGGAGKHWSDTTPEEKVRFFKIFFASQVIYVPTTPIIKLSVIFFYRRIFNVRKFKLATTVLATSLCCYFVISFLFVLFFQCKPLRKAWDPTTQGYCAAPRTRILAWQGVNTAMDFMILILPLPMLWRLKRPWQDRLALSGVFMVGGFVCGASIYRIVTLLKINNQDISYSIYDAAVWTLVEPCIGQVCGCVVIARGLFPAFKHHKTSSSTRSGRHDDMTSKLQPTSSAKETNALITSPDDTMKEAVLEHPTKTSKVKETMVELDVV